jgi:hypothetical protein
LRCANGIFLSGILLIALLSSTIMLLFPDETGDELLPIIKLAVGIWIIRSIYTLFGHTLI